MNTPDAILVYITAQDAAQARRIGKIVVEERRAACANIIDGMHSIYRWEGVVCEDDEAVLLLKTRAPLLDSLVNRVKELHSYQCPCIVALPVLGGNSDYLSWIVAETAPHGA